MPKRCFCCGLYSVPAQTHDEVVVARKKQHCWFIPFNAEKHRINFPQSWVIPGYSWPPSSLVLPAIFICHLLFICVSTVFKGKQIPTADSFGEPAAASAVTFAFVPLLVSVNKLPHAQDCKCTVFLLLPGGNSTVCHLRGTRQHGFQFFAFEKWEQ